MVGMLIKINFTFKKFNITQRVNFSVHILSQYFVSLIYIYFLYIDMKLVLKAFNQMQKTVGMRLNNKPYDITVLYVTFFFKCNTI